MGYNEVKTMMLLEPVVQSQQEGAMDERNPCIVGNVPTHVHECRMK